LATLNIEAVAWGSVFIWEHESTPVRTTTGGIMGKYLLAWLLGVPAIALVLIYFFFH
jgi:hypothetical protein